MNVNIKNINYVHSNLFKNTIHRVPGEILTLKSHSKKFSDEQKPWNAICVLCKFTLFELGLFIYLFNGYNKRRTGKFLRL